MRDMTHKIGLTLSLAAGIMLGAVPASAGTSRVPVQRSVCADMRQHMTEVPAVPAPGANRPLSAESKQILGNIATLGGGKTGSAAPNAQAQAMLNMMATTLASRSDAESQASAAYLRSMGAKSGQTQADMKALGCG